MVIIAFLNREKYYPEYIYGGFILPKKTKKPEVEQIIKCPECNSTHISRDYSRAELVCDECGLVIVENLIDHGPEWRAFDSEQRKTRSRVGAPVNYMLSDKGLSTNLGWRNQDAYGKLIPTKNRAQIYRLRKWQRRARVINASERSLSLGFAELNKVSSSMGLPRSVRERAAVLYRQATKKNLIRGRSVQVIALASIYAACRLNNLPRTLDELGNISDVSRKDIGRTYRFLSRKLDLKIMPTSPFDYVPRFCSKMKLNQDVAAKSIEILKEASDNELISGRGPVGLAAAAIYMSAVLNGCRKTQRDIAEVAGVTEVTIRNRYKEISENLNIDIKL